MTHSSLRHARRQREYCHDGTDFHAAVGNGVANVDAALGVQARAKGCIAEWQRRARSQRELMALDGCELWDIHLIRCDTMSETNNRSGLEGIAPPCWAVWRYQGGLLAKLSLT